MFKSMDEGTPLLNVSTSEPPQLSTQPVADGAEKEEKAKVKKRVRFLEEETKQKQRYDVCCVRVEQCVTGSVPS